MQRGLCPGLEILLPKALRQDEGVSCCDLGAMSSILVIRFSEIIIGKMKCGSVACSCIAKVSEILSPNSNLALPGHGFLKNVLCFAMFLCKS